MTAKEYLSQYRRITERIRQIGNEIRRLEDLADSISAENDGMPRGTKTSDRTGSLAVRIADRKAEYSRVLIEAEAKRSEIITVINSVDDPIHSRLLYDRYILGMRWDDIADDIHYEASHTRTRLHSKALQDTSQYIKDV